MSDRRFTDKAELDPAAVRSLPLNHPALLENRTLFPSTVVTVDETFTDNLLVSGRNNRKLGERITKGSFKNYALFQLSLEERATCPADCDVRAYCYGNAMHLARRHRIKDADYFFATLETEVQTRLAEFPDGIMIRLHVLGDFPSVEYVAFWADLLSEHPRLACYGYTHRLPKGAGGDEIGDAIESLKSQYKDRFRIRWSWRKPLPDGAIVINEIPQETTYQGAIVCPAQTDATACCATCGYCWEGNSRLKTIAFIKHGPKSSELAAVKAQAEEAASPKTAE